MRVKINEKNNSVWLTAALWLALAVLGLLHFGGVGRKWLALLSGAGIIVMLLRGDRKRLWNAPSLLLLGYAAWSWLTIFWAMSGKFHLREGSKILIAVFFFLFTALHKRFDGAFARRVMAVIAGIAALYGFMSVEAASTGLCKRLLGALPAMDAEGIFFGGSRLSGIFGNSNIEASICAAGIFCALAVLCGAERNWERALFAAALACSAFAFLLAFSMVALACFAAAVVFYLIAAGTGRSAALVRMIHTAVPVLVCVVAAGSLRAGDHDGMLLVLLLVCMAAGAALELFAAARFSALLEKHQRLTFGLLAGAAACAAVYAAAAVQVTGAYTFGNPITRTVELAPGVHTVRADADADVRMSIYTKNEAQTMLGESTELFGWLAATEGITITVPEDAGMCYFYLWSPEAGEQVRSVVIDGTTEVPLGYRLLPDFAANRIQQLTMSTSVLQRRVYREDALKLIRRSPIVGSGVGAFETGLTAVQDYPYETKYVHNHYLQILLEDGAVGLVLYVGALAAMAAVLWKKRKQTPESGFYRLYPALCAAFVMNGAQMMWDVSMSMIVFVCMTYALYGLIVGAFAEPFRERAAAAEESGAKKKKAPVKKRDLSLYVRSAGIGFTAVILVTLAGNLYADAKMNAGADSAEEFLSNLRTAAWLDLYEHNDAKLSYVMASLEIEGDHRAQADQYARELSGVQSNSIPYYLVNYYLQTQQYGAAVDEAVLGAAYSASDAETWNSCCLQLRKALFTDVSTSPLLSQRNELMPKLAAYRETLETYNASALQPVELDENAQAFFDEIAALEACGEDDAQFLAVLTERAQG